MRIGHTYAFETNAGRLTFMVNGTTIIAQRGDGTLMEHQVTGTQPIDDRLCAIWFPCMFFEVHEGMPLGIVGRLRHPTDTLIGFHFVDWPEWLEWGYIWNVDHLERSHWAPAQWIATGIDPEDLACQPGPLERITEELRNLKFIVEEQHPRTAAILTARRHDVEWLVDAIPEVTQVLRWLEDYQDGLIDRLALGEVGSG